MRLDPAVRAAKTLSREAPQQALALETVGRRRRRPDDEIVRRRARDRVDDGLQRLAIDVLFLCAFKITFNMTVV